MSSFLCEVNKKPKKKNVVPADLQSHKKSLKLSCYIDQLCIKANKILETIHVKSCARFHSVNEI